MSREVIRRFAPFLLILLVAGAEEGLAQVVIDAHRHHLGTAGRPEWREFAGAEPEGRGLELRFEGRANPAEATLLIRQRDVKLGWDVRINDRRIGQLHPMEAALVHALAVPAGTLRDGGNRLTIGPPPEADDVIIEGVALDPRPVREALGRASWRSASPSPAGMPACPAGSRSSTIAAPWPRSSSSRIPAWRRGPGSSTRPTAGPSSACRRVATRSPPPAGSNTGSTPGSWTLAEGPARRVDLAIRREVPTEGLVACDTHVHTLTYSGHGDATLDERAVTLAGEGIELPIATDHDHLTTDLAAAADRMGVSACFTPVVGDEVTTRTGHFNAFPFPAGAKPPDPNPPAGPTCCVRSAPRRGSGSSS